MNVLVLNDFYDLPGGGTPVAKFCAEGLARRGYSSTFVVGAGERGPDEPQTCPVVTLGLPDVRGRGARGVLGGVYSARAAAALAAFLRDHPPERTLILLNQWTRVLSPAVFHVIRRYPTLVFAHEFFLACPNGVLYDFPRKTPCARRPMGATCIAANCDRESRAHKLVRVLRTAVQNRGLARMRHVEFVFISRGQSERYARLFPPSAGSHVLANRPLNIARMAPPGPEQGEGVLFVGRMVEEKGVLELAQAARRTGVELTYVGGGPLADTVTRLYPEHRVIGWSTPESVAALTRSARAVVIPSRWAETACLAAMEPLQAGVPVALAQVICSAADLEAAGGCVAFDASTVEGIEAMLRRIASPAWAAVTAAARRRAAEMAQEDRREAYLDELEATLARFSMRAGTGLSAA